MLESVGVVNGGLNMEELNAGIGHGFKLFGISAMRNKGLLLIDILREFARAGFIPSSS